MTVTVNTSRPLTVNGPFHGFGAEEDNELVGTPVGQAYGDKGPVVPGPAGAGSDYDNVVVPRLQAMHLALARKVIDLAWLFPYSPCASDTAAGPAGCPGVSAGAQWDDPSTYRPDQQNPAGHVFYTPQSPAMEALYEDLSVLQGDGAQVLLVFQLVPGWMDPGQAYDPPTAANSYHGADEYRPAPTAPVGANPAAGDPTVDNATVSDLSHVSLYARDIAWFVSVLRGAGFTNLYALTVPNEMAHATLSIGRSGDTAACPNRLAAVAGQPLPTLLQIYRSLHQDLVADNQPFRLFGPDLYPCQIAVALRTPAFWGLLAAFDFHDYANETGNPSAAGGDFLTNLAQAATTVRPTGKQLWLTEMGDNIPWACGATYPPPPNPPPVGSGDLWSGVAVKAIDAVNAGVAGVSVWNSSHLLYSDPARPPGDCQRPWGLWGLPSTGFVLYKSYFLWTDLTSQTGQESRVYANSCDHGCQHLRFAALGSGAGHTTLVVYNGASAAQRLTVSFIGDPGSPPPVAQVGPPSFAGYVVGSTSSLASLAVPGSPDLPRATVSGRLTAGAGSASMRITIPPSQRPCTPTEDHPPAPLPWARPRSPQPPIGSSVCSSVQRLRSLHLCLRWW